MPEVKKARPAPDFGTYYNAIFKPRGFALAPHHMPLVQMMQDTRITQGMVIGPPGLGKAMNSNTPVLTPSGWKPIKEIVPGDWVMHPSGYFTNVVAVDNTAPTRLWRLTFDDGRFVDAHDNHIWRVHHKELNVVRRARDTNGKRIRERHAEVKDCWTHFSTAELADRLSRRPSLLHYVPLTRPVERVAYDLPVPPYLLGVILGDGSIAINGGVRVTKPDRELMYICREEAEKAGFSVTELNYEKLTWSVPGITERMRRFGLNGKRSYEKFIPEAYMNGSIEQRFALLQGLFDTDGYVNAGGAPDFTTTSYTLARQVQSLVWSLGGSSKLKEAVKTYTYKGEKLTGRPAYRVSIRVPDPSQFFRLSRKKDLTKVSQYAETLKLKIASIERLTEEAPSVCIQVGAEDGLFLCGDYIVTHNSSLLNVAYPSWRLGLQPEMTILGISGGEKLITTFLTALMEIIERSPIFRNFFPDVKPDKSRGWSTEKGLFVTGRPVGDQDASYFSAGLASKALTGVHAREIIMDDLHDKDNSATAAARDKVKEIFDQNILGRGDPRGCRYIMIGRRWDKDDLYGKQMSTGNWVVLHTPAQRTGEFRLWTDVFVPKGVDCIFTEIGEHVGKSKEGKGDLFKIYYGADPKGTGFYWPGSNSKRIEYFNLLASNPSSARIVYNGDTSGVEDAIFNKEDFRRYVPPDDLSLARSSVHIDKLIKSADTHLVQAWDTATGKNPNESMSSCLTGLLIPCNHWHNNENEEVLGKCEFHYDVLLLESYTENLDFGQLAAKFRSQYRRWYPRRVLVEDKSSGIQLIQAFSASEIPILGLKVTEGKIDRAINGVGGGAASVQGWAKLGRIAVPEGVPWLDSFLDAICAFRGDREQRSDQFDTLVHLVSFAIGLSRHTAIMPTHAVEAETEQSAFTLDLPFNPFTGLCGAPCKEYGIKNNKQWCLYHGKPVMAFDGCSHWSSK